LNDSLLLGEISSSDSQSGGGDDWKTDWNTDNQENQSVMKQVVGGPLWSSDGEIAEETTNPGDQDPSDDQNQERCTDGVHDGLEVTSVLSTRDQRSSATDERHLCRVRDNAVSLSTLATGSVVDDICDVLIDGQRLSSHGRLIDGKKSVTRTVLLSVFLILILVLYGVSRVTIVDFEFSEVFGVTVGVIVRADDAGISRDDLTVFDNDLQREKYS